MLFLKKINSTLILKRQAKINHVNYLTISPKNLIFKVILDTTKMLLFLLINILDKQIIVFILNFFSKAENKILTLLKVLKNIKNLK